jgi:hypothetical protein
MSVVKTISEIDQTSAVGTIVNDFSITVGTSNGSGSQTSFEWLGQPDL